MINPDYAQVTPVSWTLAVQDDGTSLNSTETFRPDGVITAEPMDDSENIGAGSGLVSLYRQKRTLHMVGGQLYGDLPADLEGTGWTWKITATLRWTNGQGVARTRTVGPFYVVAKTAETVDLAEAAKGQLTGNVWTTQGREGASVTTVVMGPGNTLEVALSDGRVITTSPLDLTGVTANASVDDLIGASPLGKELIAAETQEAARARIGAGTSNLAIGTTTGTAKDGAWKPVAADIVDATDTGRAIAKAPAGTAGQVLSTNGDGTVAWVTAPTGGTGSTGTAAEVDTYYQTGA